MSSDRPIFCSVDLAARIERVESQMIAEATAAAARRDPQLGAFVRPLAGGVACFAGGDSPLTKIAGLGFAEIAALLDCAERTVMREWARARAFLHAQLDSGESRA